MQAKGRTEPEYASAISAMVITSETGMNVRMFLFVEREKSRINWSNSSTENWSRLTRRLILSRQPFPHVGHLNRSFRCRLWVCLCLLRAFRLGETIAEIVNLISWSFIIITDYKFKLPWPHVGHVCGPWMRTLSIRNGNKWAKQNNRTHLIVYHLPCICRKMWPFSASLCFNLEWKPMS